MSRASIFDAEPLDLGDFAPKHPDAGRRGPDPSAVRSVSEANDFPSRQSAAPMQAPTAAAEPRPVLRRRRTGRNIQINIKASQATVDALYRVSDREGWVLGETLEKAIAALERELGTA